MEEPERKRKKLSEIVNLCTKLNAELRQLRIAARDSLKSNPPSAEEIRREMIRLLFESAEYLVGLEDSVDEIEEVDLT